MKVGASKYLMRTNFLDHEKEINGTVNRQEWLRKHDKAGQTLHYVDANSSKENLHTDTSVSKTMYYMYLYTMKVNLALF